VFDHATGAGPGADSPRWHELAALRFGEIGMTRMACQAEVQAWTERRFLEVLRATRYGHYDQDALVLLDENQQVIARFNRAD
jgi:heat shock protein HslJ